MASQNATLQIYSEIYSRSLEYCWFLVTSPVCNATVRTQRPNRRIRQVGCPRIDTSCPDNSRNRESIRTWSWAEKCTRMSLEWEMSCLGIQRVPTCARWIKCNWKACSSWNSNCDTKATSLSSTRVGTRRSPRNRSNEATFAYQSVVTRHRQRSGESL